MVRIEGYTRDELLAMPSRDLDEVVLLGRPVVINVGTAQVLAECHRRGPVLIVDLGHIDGGGEGALPTLVAFVSRFAESRGFEQIEWLVRATNCARPNAKLRRVLLRKGFEVRQIPEFGECFFKASAVGSNHAV